MELVMAFRTGSPVADGLSPVINAAMTLGWVMLVGAFAGTLIA